MRALRNHLTRVHVIVFVVLLATFTVVTFLITSAGLDDGSEHNTRVLQATAGTISGPLVGAISRGFQECCLGFSLDVMLYCVPVLIIGIMTQFIHLPDRRWVRGIRMALWVLGWLVWFLGGVLSFGHALS